MKKKALSIIIPVYNVEAYLEQCVKSILDQSTPEVEVMLGKLLSHRYTRIKSINFYVILVFSAFFILYLMRDSIVVVPYKIWQ